MVSITMQKWGKMRENTGDEKQAANRKRKGI
jgi:hypothetical protein